MSESVNSDTCPRPTADRRGREQDDAADQGDLGFGRIVVSERDVPIILVKLV